MELHNVLEEQVINRVKTLYDDIIKNENIDWLSCTCNQCRLDTAAYVLNRLSPKYVVSERGIAHALSQKTDQADADLDSLIIQGMKKIASSQRPFHGKDNDQNIETKPPVASFNFPIFRGQVYDGESFEPLKDGQVMLQFNTNANLDMVDNTWVNPYFLNTKTMGEYTFLVKPLPADMEGQNKRFDFVITVEAPNYEKTIHTFSIVATSVTNHDTAINIVNTLKIQDLYVFSKD